MGLEIFFGLANRLSPENLCCDGEISGRQVAIRRREIMNEWKILEQKIGRRVTLTEVETAQIQEYVRGNK